jgi:hypothetical protein
MEVDTFAGESVQGRSVDVRVAAHSNVPPTLVVGNDEQNIRRLSGGEMRSPSQGEGQRNRDLECHGNANPKRRNKTAL